jgi:hypothetical protein
MNRHPTMKPCTGCGKLIAHDRTHRFEQAAHDGYPDKMIAELCDECCPNCFGGVGVRPK